MDNVSIVVVLYNCEIRDSITLAGINEANVYFEQSNLVIWNNGPKKLQDSNTEHLKGTGFNITIEETVENKSLAEIYNAFIQKYPAKHYVILDDDSSITGDYLKHLKTLKNEQVVYPIILSNGKPCSPKINRKKLPRGVQLKDIKLNDNDKVEAIGSGLIISHELVNSIRSQYDDLFDERFYIYGVDTTFCWRVASVLAPSQITIVDGFSHSVSRNDDEPKAVKLFRQIEKANSKGLKIHHYKSKFIKWFKTIQLLALLLIPFYRTDVNKQYLLALLTGIHYNKRNKKGTTTD